MAKGTLILPDHTPAGEPEGRPPEIRPEHLTKLVVIYLRQSTLSQVEENTGSTAAQRALAELAQRWGWPDSLIKVVDDDLGCSGTSSESRTGFHWMLNAIARGEVAMVMVHDVSRLSRAPLDAELFLSKAIRAGVLMYVNGRVYDPANAGLAELFGLRIQNLLAWWDNAARVRTFRLARVARVGQGYAVTRPPIGYYAPVRGHWEPDPSPGVQAAVRRVFELYLKLGSINKVVKYHHAHGLPFPRRVRGVIQWDPITPMDVLHLLKNPLYTGDYVFCRMKVTPPNEHEKRRVEPRPRSQWHVRPDHHEPYVSHDESDQIQAMLARNRVTHLPPIGKGPALLQGMLWCERCKRLIRTVYRMRVNNWRPPSYQCRPADRCGHFRRCFSSPAAFLDRVVVREVLCALTPPGIEAALAAIENTITEHDQLREVQARLLRQAQARVEQLRYRYDQVDPKNWRVKPMLEADLHRAAEQVATLERELKAQASALPVTLAPEDAAELVRRGSNLERLWNSATAEDRKQLLRTVVTQVVVTTASEEWIDIEIVWAGGQKDPRRIYRRKGVEQLVMELRGDRRTPAEIVDSLRTRGITTMEGQPMSKDVVWKILRQLGMHRHPQWVAALTLIRELKLQRVPHRVILDQLREKGLRHWLGDWTLRGIESAVQALRRGKVPPEVASLQRVQDENRRIRTSPEAVHLIHTGRQQKRSWDAIVGELNARGLRSVLGHAFTVLLARNLYSTWLQRGLLPKDGPAAHRGIETAGGSNSSQPE